MDTERDIRSAPRRRSGAAATVIILVVALLAVGVHVWAETLDRRARDTSLPSTRRVEAAVMAQRLEPFNRRLGVTLAIARAEDLVSRGDVDGAYELLLPLSTTVRDDRLFRDTYQRVLALKWPLDSRKAHVQHGREDRDGALDPEDVER